MNEGCVISKFIEIQPEIYHVMPNDGKHQATFTCWCCPFLYYKDPDTQNEVWEHREYQS